MRGGGFSLTVSPVAPGHVLTAFVTNKAGVPSCLPADDFRAPRDIAFAESVLNGDGGTWNTQNLTAGEPPLLRISPEIVIDGRNNVFVTYWEGDPMGFIVTQRVAVRQAGSTSFAFYDRGTFDLRNGPLKCGDNDSKDPIRDHHSRFLGDYRVGRGSIGYVSTLRTTYEQGRMVLQLGQMSSTSWR